MITTVSTGVSQTNRNIARSSMLAYAKDRIVFGQYAKPFEIKSHEGDTYTWFRPQQLGVAITSLEDGVTPGGASMGFDKVTCSVSQYGNFMLYTDKVNTIPEVRLMDIGAKLLGENMALTLDVLHRNNLNTNASTIIYASNAANTAAITTSQVFSSNDLKRIRRKLTRNVAPRIRAVLAALVST